MRFLIQQLFLAAPAQSTVPLVLISVSALPFASMAEPLEGTPSTHLPSPLSLRELQFHQPGNWETTQNCAKSSPAIQSPHLFDFLSCFFPTLCCRSVRQTGFLLLSVFFAAADNKRPERIPRFRKKTLRYLRAWSGTRSQPFINIHHWLYSGETTHTVRGVNVLSAGARTDPVITTWNAASPCRWVFAPAASRG